MINRIKQYCLRRKKQIMTQEARRKSLGNNSLYADIIHTDLTVTDITPYTDTDIILLTKCIDGDYIKGKK